MAEEECSSTHLIVNYLPDEFTEEEVKAMFGGVGTLVDCSLARSRDTGALRGYAFLEYSSAKDTDRAVAELNGLLVMGKKIKVARSRPRHPEYQQTNLFVQRIPGWTTQQVKEYFEQFGEIIDCKVLERKEWYTSPFDAGFVRYFRRSDAEAAREATNGLEVGHGVFLSVEISSDARLYR